MSKPQALTITTVAAPEQVKPIGMALLQSSPNNPRTTFDQVTLGELADSIRAIGIQVALLALHRSDLELKGYQSPERGRKEFLAMLKLLGVDGKDAWKAKPEPKAEKAAAKKKVAPKKTAKKKAGAR